MKNEELDRLIATAVGVVEHDIPNEVERAIARRVASWKPEKRVSSFWGWRQTWAALAAAGLVLGLALLPVWQRPPAPEKKITQIRTEINLPDKNIKILWVQRDDFRIGGTGE